MGSQKNRLNETVYLSTQNYAKSYGLENSNNFTLKIFVYLNLCLTSLFFQILAPSGPPEEISIRRESDSSLLLQWSPPKKDQRKGKITAYQVCIHLIVIIQYPSHTVNALKF